MGDRMSMSVVVLETCWPVGGPGAQTSFDALCIGDDDAGTFHGGVNGCVLGAQESWVIEAVAKEVLMFNAVVSIGECAAWRLKIGQIQLSGVMMEEPARRCFGGGG